MFLCYRKDVPKQEHGDVCPSFCHITLGLTWAPVSRLNTFLELKMENERLQHRVRELRAQKAPFILQTPPSSTVPTLTASTNFGAHPSSTTSSQLAIDPTPSVVLDHSESTIQPIPTTPVTRNLDVAGLQEGDQDEPAKKKVSRSIFRRNLHLGLKPCILDQETNSANLPTGLCDVWENGLARVEKGSCLLQVLMQLFDGIFMQGPLGPKTLCNACGLRWAKQARRFDDAGEGGGANTVV